MVHLKGDVCVWGGRWEVGGGRGEGRGEKWKRPREQTSSSLIMNTSRYAMNILNEFTPVGIDQ